MPKGPDFTQVARAVVDKATGEKRDKRRNPAAVELGKLGGKAKWAKARAETDAPEDDSSDTANGDNSSESQADTA
ncbi:MAG: hypothetical protein M3Q30_07750 [Actinomycetota bacterium]|nr:hypothetical protein [Actinomycetota bacterium]